jgi:AraC-like DNA-binding protein
LGTLFSGLITSKIRIKILMRLFLHPEQKVYLRELADEFQASPSHIKDELQQLMESNLLTNKKQGKQINYQANTVHPLYPELNSMVKKALGMDQILESIIERLGNLKLAMLLDDYAEGKDSGLIDLLLVGDIERNNLEDLVFKTEKYIGRKLRILVLTVNEYKDMKKNLLNKPHLLLWNSDDFKNQ